MGAEKFCIPTEFDFSALQTHFSRLPDAGHEFYIGGNAALMARRFALAAPSARVLVAGWLPANLREMLPKNVEFIPDAQEVLPLFSRAFIPPLTDRSLGPSSPNLATDF